MTTSQIIACAVSAAAAIMSIAALIGTRRQAAHNRRERELPVYESDGVITFPHRMSDAEVEEFKARWQAAHGRPGTPPRGPAGASSANQGRAVTRGVCSAYQPPATAEMTGLCARCGMFDYKHKEAPGA